MPVRPNACGKNYLNILLLAVRLQGCNSFAYNVSWVISFQPGTGARVKRALVMSYIISSEFMGFPSISTYLIDISAPPMIF